MKKFIDSWLTPDGEIIEVGDNSHNKYAAEYLEKEMGGLDYWNFIMGDDYTYDFMELHKRGWVRISYNEAYLPRIGISGGTISYEKPMRNTMNPAMNERQLMVAEKLCEECNTTLHMAINPKCFW